MTEAKTPHRRHHRKADGRNLYLYGWEPHTLEPTVEIEPVPPPDPHSRWHPFRREWVTYAAHRQARTFKPPAEYCPLCPTQPGGFAGEIPFADFEVAVFENRFPGFHAEAASAPDLPVETTAARGTCEVLVFTPAHQGDLAGLTQARRELLVHAWADRYTDLLGQPHVQCVLPFENKGEEVGVTLHHPHGQIYAFPWVPPVQQSAATTFREGPALARLLDRMGDSYTVCARDSMVAFVPPFARFPYEVWIAPRRPLPGPWEMTAEEISDYASLLGELVTRYDGLFDRSFPYIMSLHAAPKGEEKTFHFHTQFYPPLRTAEKLKYLAGVEQVGGAFLVDALPEDTAARLRDAAPA